jgi:hypothetical protein
LSTALFERPEFADLKQFFSSLKLHLIFDNSDVDALEKVNLGPIKMRDLFRKYLEFFEPFQYSWSEDHLRVGIWAPLLTDLLS